MKKYSNIPLKERKRNADRVYRHENRLEEINQKREMRELIELKERQWAHENEHKTDKEQMETEAFARLKDLMKGSE